MTGARNETTRILGDPCSPIYLHFTRALPRVLWPFRSGSIFVAAKCPSAEFPTGSRSGGMDGGFARAPPVFVEPAPPATTARAFAPAQRVAPSASLLDSGRGSRRGG